jgi:hypothetical protein
MKQSKQLVDFIKQPSMVEGKRNKKHGKGYMLAPDEAF